MWFLSLSCAADTRPDTHSVKKLGMAVAASVNLMKECTEGILILPLAFRGAGAYAKS